MQIISSKTFQSLEHNYLKKNPQTTPEILMDEVAKKIYLAVKQFINPKNSHIILLIGKGNNSADIYTACTHFIKKNCSYQEYLTCDISDMNALCKKKRQSLHNLQKPTKFNKNQKIIILDGLLGIGAKGKLKSNFEKACQYANKIREEFYATTFAIDLPTGIGTKISIKADFTLTIGMPKKILLNTKYTNAVGRISLLPLSKISSQSKLKNKIELITPNEIRLSKTPQRPFSSHKGSVGKIAIVSGSKKYTGSAILTAHSALESGGGLIHSYIKNKSARKIISSKIKPEIICEKFKSFRFYDKDIIIYGPGIGQKFSEKYINKFKDWITIEKKPIIIDADGINLIAKYKLLELLNHSAKKYPRLITPHIGEMKRLLLAHNQKYSEDKIKTTSNFTQKFQNIILHLKSERSITAKFSSNIIYNSSGNPAMAGAGVGDLLCGLIASTFCSIKKSYSPQKSLYIATIRSAYITGRASEIYLKKNNVKNITASKIIKTLPKAIQEIHSTKTIY